MIIIFLQLSDQELNKIKTLPNRRLTQVRYENKIIQENYLEDLRGALNSLAERESFEILDLINVADKAPSNLELFLPLYILLIKDQTI